MSYVTLHRVDNHHSIQCSTPVTGTTLLQLLDQERLTLASVTPLRDGSVHRRYRFIGHDSIFDLTQYQELYTPDRKLLACIDMAQECMR